MNKAIDLFLKNLDKIMFDASDRISKVILQSTTPTGIYIDLVKDEKVVNIYKNYVRGFLIYDKKYFCDYDNHILNILSKKADEDRTEFLIKFNKNNCKKDDIADFVNKESEYLKKASEIMISRFLSSKKQCELIKEELHEIELCKYFINILTIVSYSNYEILADFKSLSEILCKSSIKPKEKLEIIIYFLNLIPPDLMEKLDDITIILKKINMEIDIKAFFKNYEIIKKYSSSKEDMLDKTDIQNITEALIEIGVDKSLAYSIKSSLEKELKSKNRDNKALSISYETEENRKIKEKERCDMIKQLDMYFDFKNMKCIRFLSMSEVLYVVSILKKLKYDNETIRNFIIINEYQLNMSNPITRYVQLYDKLKYYVEKYGLLDEFKELNDYFNELFISDDNDYSFYKSCLDKQLNYILSLIPRNYDYELRNTK